MRLLELDPDDRRVIYRDESGRRIVQEGDSMDIPLGEVFVLKLADMEVLVVLVKTHEDSPCENCPLYSYECGDFIICPDYVKCTALEDAL